MSSSLYRSATPPQLSSIKQWTTSEGRTKAAAETKKGCSSDDIQIRNNDQRESRLVGNFCTIKGIISIDFHLVLREIESPSSRSAVVLVVQCGGRKPLISAHLNIKGVSPSLSWLRFGHCDCKSQNYNNSLAAAETGREQANRSIDWTIEKVDRIDGHMGRMRQRAMRFHFIPQDAFDQ